MSAGRPPTLACALAAVVAVAVLVGLPTGSRPAAAATASESLAIARGHYEAGDYKKAADLVFPLLYPQARLQSAEEIVEAHRLLGASYFYLGRLDAARREMVALLYLEPEYELDPVLETAELYAYFESIKKELERDLAKIRAQKQRQAQADDRVGRVITIERDHYPTEWYVNWIPFGYPQFQGGRSRWGTAFAVSQGITGTASLALFAAQLVRYGYPLRVPRAEVPTAQALQIGQIASGGFFFVFYGAQVLEALSNPRPRLVERRSEQRLEPGLTSGLTLDPLVAPGVVGLGATFTF